MACNETCSKDANQYCGNHINFNYVTIIVLYILLAIIIGSCLF